MNNTSFASLKAARYPTEMELAAYNEAGHAVVGTIQGRYIECIVIKQEGEKWGGQTKQDLYARHFVMPELPPHALYTRIGDYPIPRGGDPFKPVENCVLKFAGVVAEELLCEQLGINSSEVRIGQYDITEAKEWAKIGFPDDEEKQQTILHNGRAFVYAILRNSTCWHVIENLAKAIINEHEKEPVMSGDRAHKVISQAFSEAATEQYF